MAEIIDRRISFNAGEISPWLDPRLDLDKYRMGCRTLQNMRPSIYGGAFSRSGTRFLGAAAVSDSAARLIPFTREIATNYLLELSDHKIRVWDAATQALVASIAEGAWTTATAYLPMDVVSHDGNNYQVLESHTSGTFATDLAADKLRLYPVQEIVSPFTAAQLDEIQTAQQNDVLFLAHPAHFPQLLARLADGTWRLSPLNIDWPATLGPNLSLTTITPLVEIYNAGEPAAWTAGSYAALSKRKHNGNYYINTVAANTTEPGTAAALGYWIEGRWINAAGVSAPPAYSNSVYYTRGTLVTYQATTYVRTALFNGDFKGWSPGDDYGDFQLWDTAVTPIVDPALGMVAKGSSIVLKSSTPIWEAGHVGTQWLVGHRRDVLQESFFPRDVSVGYVSDPVYVLGEWTVQVTHATAPTELFEVNVMIERSVDLINWEPHYAVNSQYASVQQLLTGSEEMPLFLRLKLSSKSGTVTGLLGVVLTAGNPTQTGIVQIQEVTSSTQVVALVLSPIYRYLPTTLWEEPAWTDSFGYPRAVTLHENRLFFGGTKRKPTTVWGSAIDAYQDFRLASQDDRAVVYTLASDESSAIEWLVSQDMLVIGTSSGEWVMGQRPGDEVPKLRRNTSFGSASIQARAIADALVFVQRSRRKVREFSWSFERDGYQSNDLIMLSEHLGDAEFRQIAIQRNPESVVWVATTRGDLLSLTYERGQNVAGWARHVTDGSIESVAVVSGPGEEDHVWLAVKRTIDGADVRYVERIEPDQLRAIKQGERDELVYSDSALVLTAGGAADGDVAVTGCANASGPLFVPNLIYQSDVVSRPSYAVGDDYTLAAELPKASATLNPTGANNEIFIEAVTGGVAGNSFTVEIATPSGEDTAVEVSGSEITVTPWAKARMIVSGITSHPDMNGEYFYAGEYDYFGIPQAAWTHDGLPFSVNEWNANPGAGRKAIYRSTATQWKFEDSAKTYTVYKVGSEAFPDEVANWSNSFLESEPTVIAAPISAQQVIAAINANVSALALVTATNAPGSDGSGAVAAVTATSLTGGSDTPHWRLTVEGNTWFGNSTETYPWDIAPGDWAAVSPASGTPLIVPANALFAGLDHLEGETVSILADGAVHRPLIVSGGEITLDRPAAVAVVGLPFDAILGPTWFETMDPQSLSKHGRKRILSILLEFWQTRGCEISVDAGETWTPVRFRTSLDTLYLAEPLFSGILEEVLSGSTARQVNVLLKQSQPLPFHLMSLGSKYTVEMP